MDTPLALGGVVPLPPGAALASDDALYEIVASTALPVIDISRSVRSVLFSSHTVAIIDHYISRMRHLLFIGYHVAIVLSTVAFAESALIGRWLALPAVFSAMFGLTSQVLLMRFEILRLLFTTYDFWFFSTIWLFTMTLFAVCLADLRASMAFMIWLGMQTNIMLDSSTSFRESICSTTIGLFYSMAIVIFVSFGAVDELRDFTLARTSRYVIRAQDAIVNGWMTCLLVLVRNIYRRRAAIRDHGANKTVVQCISYRCRVRLHSRVRRRRSASSLSSITSSSSVSSVQMTRPTASYFQNARMVQMRCMRVRVKFSPRNLLLPFARHLLEYRDDGPLMVILRTSAMVLMVLSLVLTPLSFIHGISSGVRIASISCTVAFCMLSVALYHRQLLRYLIFSFDYAFLSVQISIMHVGLCDLYGWDSRILAIASVWLWVHWVLTFDCIPPVIKSKLRLRYRLVVWVVLLFVAAHVALVYQLVSYAHGQLHDRIIFTIELKQHQVNVRVLPLLVSRMPMTFGWSCRIVWRLLCRNENDLIIIQGTVTYINNRRKLKEQEKQYSATIGRTATLVQELARQVTRRASAFALAIVPSVSANSLIKAAASTVDDAVSPFSATSMSSAHHDHTRFANIAGQVVAAHAMAMQHHSISPGSRRDITVFDASINGPRVFQVFNSSGRASLLDTTPTLSKVAPLSVPGKSDDDSDATELPRSTQETNHTEPGFVI